MGRTKAGDGSTLQPMRHIQFLWRTQLGVDHGGSRWVIAASHASDDERIDLYRDGVQVARATSPARFDVDGGRIEAKITMGAVRRARLVTPAGRRPLEPERGTAEHGRARIAERWPVLSSTIAALSLVVVAVAALLELPQLLQLVTHVEIVESYLGWSFDSPISLPAWLNTTIVVAAAVASMERALRLRFNPLLDG